jgi:hypothetical protein
MASKALLLGAMISLFSAACSSSPNGPTAPYADAGRDVAVASDGPRGDSASDGADGSRADAGDAADGPVDLGPPPTLTAAVVKAIDLPGVPVVATYNAGTKKAYFSCRTPAGASAGVAVVDDVTNAVVATITPAAAVTSLAANATTKIVYGAEGAQIDVIDSVTDTISTTLKTPDSSPIVGLAVDEAHNLTYVLTTLPGMTELFVLNGATNMIMNLRSPLLTPAGRPPMVVDGTTQQVFILGVDSNNAGEVITLDGPSGSPTHLATTDSLVDAEVSGIVSLGNGAGAVLFVKPTIVKGLEGEKDVTLPASFTPAGVAAADLGHGPLTIVVGFGAGTTLDGYGVNTATGALSPFSVPLAASLPAGTTATRLLTAAPIANGSELYVDATPDPKSDAGFSPTQTIKIAVTSALP